MAFEAAGFKHDPQCRRLRLSAGRNLTERRSGFALRECEPRPDVDLAERGIQRVGVVYERDERRLQFVCRTTIDPGPPSEATTGIDLGIANVAAVSVGGESLVYPGGAFTADGYYFAKERAETDDSASREATRLDRKRAGRRTHLLHTLPEDIVAECVDRRRRNDRRSRPPRDPRR